MRPAIAQFGGLVVAPAAWAVNMQLGQILPHIDCASELILTATGSFIAMLLAIIGTVLSYRTYTPSVSRGTRFVAGLAVLIGAAFVFALYLQGAATLLLDACER
ncbi:hypothetical protein KX729_28640 [Rhizobium sp. XQZ8]|uniref:hypothetical protein n=1 Tax=Rhizobium populisoli TaxID=2859785 RepID=UPI001CA566BB|nr:hypothetical protein [Rhizobium populisoli]MBW6425399.1 hypothetical protein [Rhizobium populisoli]